MWYKSPNMIALTVAILTVFTLLPDRVQAHSDSSLSGVAMYAINRNDGTLYRYDFSGGQLNAIGVIQSSLGVPLAGIEASAYVPGFQNIFCFWTDPADQQNKLVYVNVETAEAAIVADDLEGGQITGAVVAQVVSVSGPDSTPVSQWTVFAVQQALVTPPVDITGLININPNNRPDSEFPLVNAADGITIDRDDLHRNTPVGAGGVFYRGDTTMIRVKPKGNGNQNGLMVDGELFVLQNSNTYLFNGYMQVEVYNDRINGGRQGDGQVVDQDHIGHDHSG